MPRDTEDPVLEAAIESALSIVDGACSPRLREELRQNLRLSAAIDPSVQVLLGRLQARQSRPQSGSSPTIGAPGDEDTASGRGEK